jgi:hypothetical protein
MSPEGYTLSPEPLNPQPSAPRLLQVQCQLLFRKDDDSTSCHISQALAVIRQGREQDPYHEIEKAINKKGLPFPGEVPDEAQALASIIGIYKNGTRSSRQFS